MIHKMTMVADSAERLQVRLLRMVLRSTRLIGRICSTPAQSLAGHPVELDPQRKVHMRREEVQLGAAQREEAQREAQLLWARLQVVERGSLEPRERPTGCQ